jgi:diguanylate cyclase (GGDEF)-like protein
MNFLTNNVLTIWIAIALSGLVSMFGVFVLGMLRRRQWVLETHAINRVNNNYKEHQIRRAYQAKKASDFNYGLLRRIYYFIVLTAAILGTTLSFVTLERNTQFHLFLAMNGAIWISALFVCLFWHGWDNDHEVMLLKNIRQAWEYALSKRGIVTRDSLTGTYQPEFWLKLLKHRTHGRFGKQTQITYLKIKLMGLTELSSLQDDGAVDYVLFRVGQEIKNNVRSSDLVCRCGDQEFTVALFSCPPKYGKSIAERITANVSYIVLESFNHRYGSSLQLRWEQLARAEEATTSNQSFHVTDRNLKKQAHDVSSTEDGKMIMRPAQGLI